jgi:CBS domain-containing protein
MKIRDIMTPTMQIASPDDTLQAAAEKMATANCGALPVGENDRLVGMITDRDIVTRAVADGIDPTECYVGEIMSEGVKYCYEDESLEDLARNMADLQIKRLPVVNHDKRLVGIVSLGDVAVTSEGQAQRALSGIAQDNGLDRSSRGF